MGHARKLRSKPTYDKPSPATNCGSTANPSSKPTPARFKASKHSCAGNVQGSVSSCPTSSSRSPKKPGSSPTSCVWVLDQACRHAAAWARRWPDQHLSVAVNLSSANLLKGELVDAVADALARTGLHPTRLTLELTETTLIGRHNQRGTDPSRTPPTWRQPRPRRLRDRLLITHLPPLVPHQHHQDRQVLHLRNRHRTRRHRHRRRHHQPRQETSTSTSSQKASKTTNNSRCCSSSAAPTSRATCSPNPNPSTTPPSSSPDLLSASHQRPKRIGSVRSPV